MKRLTTILLLAAVFTAAACLPAGSSAAAFPAETVNRLLDDLIGSQYMEEQLYGDLLGVLDAFDRFDREKSWENLQKARAALFLAKSRAARLQPPETTLTAEDQMLILDAGVSAHPLSLKNLGLEDGKIWYRLRTKEFSSIKEEILEQLYSELQPQLQGEAPTVISQKLIAAQNRFSSLISELQGSWRSYPKAKALTRKT